MHRDSGKSKTRQGQSTPPHVRFYANDWFTGVAALKADERGVYISICVHIWTTGQRVPLDDAEAARRLCLQFNLYQRVRDKLLRLEKITKNIDGYGNNRAETELDRATNARSEAGNGVPTDSRPDARNGHDGRPEPDVAGCSKQGGAPTHSASGSTVDAHAATDSALLGAHGGACQGAPMGAHGGACHGEAEKTESNQRPSIEPRTKNQEPRTKNMPASIESVAARSGLAGLNGSVLDCLSEMAAMLPSGDTEQAAIVLEDFVAQYGAAAVKEARLKLRTDMAAGKTIREPLSVWRAIAKREADAPRAARPMTYAEARAAVIEQMRGAA